MKIVNMPVAVTAYFSKQRGVPPTPHRFYVAEGDEKIEVKIKPLGAEKFFVNKKIVYRFTCQGIVNNQKRNFELRFEPLKMSWTLFKM